MVEFNAVAPKADFMTLVRKKPVGEADPNA